MMHLLRRVLVNVHLDLSLFVFTLETSQDWKFLYIAILMIMLGGMIAKYYRVLI